MNDVRYAYRAGHDVLNGLSLTIRPGERLAIVGPSGAGKSTLGRLLAGIDAPRSGSVMVGDVALASMPLPMLRRHVALVTQEHHIFIGTVRENLALAKPEATDDEIVRALDAVDALEWVRRLARRDPHRARHDGLPGLAGPGPADRARATRLERPAHPRARRGDRLLDPRAARHLERSLVRGPAGPNGRGDRAPPAHRPRRRPGLRRHRRQDRRARHPRRAGRAATASTRRCGARWRNEKPGPS